MADLRLDMLLAVKDKASPELNRFKRNVNGLQSQLVTLGAKLAGVIGVGAFTQQLVSVNREFESLKKSLVTVTGSAGEAEQAFKFIQNIAQNLPESVQDITTAFIRMQSLGLTPTREALTSFANTANAMGKSLIQFVEAVADAATGEFERLKEFGIKARTEGEEVAFTFQGVTTRVRKNATDISNYLESIGNVQFAGAAAAQMDTINGRVSNLKDTFDRLLVTIGEGGFNDVIKRALEGVTEAINFLNERIVNVRLFMIAFFQVLVNGWIQVKYEFEAVALFFEVTWTNLIALLTNLWGDFIDSIKETSNAVLDFLGFEPIFESSERARRSTKDLTAEIDKLKKAKAEEKKAVAAAFDIWADDIIQKNEAAKQTSDYNEKLKEQKRLQDEVASSTKTATDEKKKELTVYQQLIKTIKENRVQVEQAWDAQMRLDEAFIAGKISADEYQMALEETNNILGVGYSESVDDAKKNTDDLSEHLKQAARSMQQNFSDFFFDAMQGNFGNLADSFKRTIDRMVADLIASQLFELLVGNFGSTGSIGGFVGSLLGREHGGPVQRGTPYIVGEKRPEIFVPNVSGTILPDAEKALGDLAPTAANNIAINIQAMDSQDVRRALEGNKRWLTDLLSNTGRNYNMA